MCLKHRGGKTAGAWLGSFPEQLGLETVIPVGGGSSVTPALGAQESVWELERAGGCTASWLYEKPLNFTLEWLILCYVTFTWRERGDRGRDRGRGREQKSSYSRGLGCRMFLHPKLWGHHGGGA